MTREEIESKLEFLEATDMEKAHGLRPIKRRHYTGPLEKLPNLETVSTSLLLAKLRESLLDDTEFVEKLREKLAA